MLTKQTEEYAVYQTTDEHNAGTYSLPPCIQQSFENLFCRQVRSAFKLNDETFEAELLQRVLQRQSVLVTSDSFNHRQSFREVCAAAMVSFLVNKFAIVSLYNQDNLQRQQRHVLQRENERTGAMRLNSGLLDGECGGGSELSSDRLENISEISRRPQHHFNGFARMQVLIITDSRHSAWRIVSNMIALFPGLERKNVANFKLFERHYAPDDEIQQYEVAGQKLLIDEIPEQLEGQLKLKKPL